MRVHSRTCIIFRRMDRGRAISEAKRFADNAYVAAHETILREFQEKLKASRAQLAARGMIRSGAALAETGRINGERITATLQARLDSLLEGYELHAVPLDEELTTQIITQLIGHRSTMLDKAVEANDRDPVTQRLVGSGSYRHVVESNIRISPSEMRAQIDRRRLMPKKTEASTSINIYHVTGHNNRWVTNSQDHSVNVVTQSSEQIFASLRREIESHVPVGDERTDILERLTALEQAQTSPSFAQRYTDFISAAANHIVLLTPFIPALTEILQKTLTR